MRAPLIVKHSRVLAPTLYALFTSWFGGQVTMLILQHNRIPPETVARKCCKLLTPVRDHEGRIRFHETPRILEELDDLGRHMLLVQFEDGAPTFLFAHEVVIEAC